MICHPLLKQIRQRCLIFIPIPYTQEVQEVLDKLRSAVYYNLCIVCIAHKKYKTYRRKCHGEKGSSGDLGLPADAEGHS